MRDYGMVTPSFWLGRTGKMLRDEPEAQIVALYLISCPHANMLGIFHCPVLYIAHETGRGFEGASKGLKRLCELEFCMVDGDLDLVWVREFARVQIGESVRVTDNRIKAIWKEFSRVPESPIKLAFAERYGSAFSLHMGVVDDDDQAGSPVKSKAPSKPLHRGSKAPSKPLRSQDQDQEHHQDLDQPTPSQGGADVSERRADARTEDRRETAQAYREASGAGGGANGHPYGEEPFR